MVKGKVKYKRKAKKNGKAKMSSQRKWLIAGVLFSILVLAGLILFLLVKPEFLEGVFQRNSDASMTPSANSQTKETNPIPGNTATHSTPSSTNSKSQAVVSLSGSNDYPDYSAYYVNLASVLSQTPMVQDIPRGETVLLRFYNFNTGNREFEKSYILTKSSAKEGFLENTEIAIVIHSKYVPELNNNNLCETINRADANNDVGIYTDLSTTKLITKFSGMMKYKDCIL